MFRCYPVLEAFFLICYYLLVVLWAILFFLKKENYEELIVLHEIYARNFRGLQVLHKSQNEEIQVMSISYYIDPEMYSLLPLYLSFSYNLVFFENC